MKIFSTISKYIAWIRHSKCSYNFAIIRFERTPSLLISFNMMSSSFKQKLLCLNCVKSSFYCIVLMIFGIIFGYVMFPKILKTIMKMVEFGVRELEIARFYIRIFFCSNWIWHLALKCATCSLRYRFRWILKSTCGISRTKKKYLPVENRNYKKLDHITSSWVSFACKSNNFYFSRRNVSVIFLCREWKVKYDLVDDDEADTLEYSYKNTFIYDPSKNGPGLTGEESITLIHPLILGMALGVNVDRQELLPFIANAINGILQAPTDPFFTGRVMDILFDGVPIDCRSDEFEVAAACGEFSTGEYKAIQPYNETFYKFSLFGGVSFNFLKFCLFSVGL